MEGFNMNTPVSYIHIRDHAEGKDGKKTVVSNGGACIGYMRDGNNVIFAIAKCKYPDVYCRRVGRAIVRGRLMHDRGTKLIEIPETAFRGQVRAQLLNEYYASLEQYVPDAHMHLY